MLCRFATLSNLVQLCSAMLRAVQSILKAVKNVQWTRLNFFCLKKMFSRFATPTEHCPVCASALQMQEREFRHDGEEMESSASIGSMNNRERYSGSNEDSSQTRSIAVLMTRAIAENEDTMILMGQAAGLIDLQHFS